MIQSCTPVIKWTVWIIPVKTCVIFMQPWIYCVCESFDWIRPAHKHLHPIWWVWNEMERRSKRICIWILSIHSVMAGIQKQMRQKTEEFHVSLRFEIFLLWVSFVLYLCCSLANSFGAFVNNVLNCFNFAQLLGQWKRIIASMFDSVMQDTLTNSTEYRF